MTNFNGCELMCFDPIVVVGENRSSFRVRNGSRRQVRKIKVDGCVFRNEIACDYLLILEGTLALFVELKGSDLWHAYTQLGETTKKLSRVTRAMEKRCFIVVTRSPAFTPEIQKMKMKFKKGYKASLEVKCREYIFDYTN